MEKVIRLKEEYNRILKNFLPYELERACISSFGDDIWNDIRKHFKSKGNLSKKDFADVVTYIFQVMDYGYLKETLPYIQLSDLSFHSKKRTWYSFELCGIANYVIMSERVLKRKLVASFQKMNLKYDITVIMFDEVFWIRVASPSDNMNNALYLAYFIGEKFIFINKRMIKFKLMQAIASALKYESLKILNLNGKDVWSLLKMLEQKESKALETAVDHARDRYAGHSFIHGSRVFDFTKRRMRKAEIENCLGSNPPVLQSFTIKSESGLRVGEVLPEMEGYPCKVRVELNHPNLHEFLKEAAERNVITHPLPQYMKHFPITGKNVITLKDTRSRK